MTQGQSPLAIAQFPLGGRFETVARHDLGIEGGHSNALADRGGETNYGISLRFAVAEGVVDANHDGFKDLDLDFDGDIDGQDIRALTPDEALNLYYTCIWRRLDLDNLPKPLDGAVFDQALNCGAVAAVKMLQRALNRMPLTCAPLAIDGGLGRITQAAIGMCIRLPDGVALLLDKYRQEAELHYNAIVRADPTQVEWLKGWVNRARRLGDV